MSEDTTTETPAGEAPTGNIEDTTDWKAEARKWEDRAKKDADKAKAAANAMKELEELKKASLSDQEKAVAEAVATARAAAFAEVGGKLVDAAVRVAAAGRVDDTAVAVLLQGLDRSKFLTDDGEVDEKSVAAFIDGIAPKPQETPAPAGFPDLGQGSRGQMALNGDPLERSLKNALGIR